MADEQIVWAKFSEKKGLQSLSNHIDQCLSVMTSLQRIYGDIPERSGQPRFYELLFYAVILHDFGKSSGWQRQWQNGARWNYRHEILSAAFVAHLNVTDEERTAVALAIYTHHKSLERLEDDQYRAAEYDPEEGMVSCSSFEARLPELAEYFPALQEIWEQIPAKALRYLGVNPELHAANLSVEQLVNAYGQYLHPRKNRSGKTADTQMFRIWLRGMLEVCDHLGSAGIDGVLLHRRAFSAGFVPNFRATELQVRMERAVGSCCVISPTGTGKTEVALLWADRNFLDRPGARLFFVLPYTASINAMHKRLTKVVGGQPEEVAMLHGRALDFLYHDLVEGADVVAAVALRTASRLHSQAREIHAAHKIVTPHQLVMAFLGLRGFEKRLTELTNALIIVDEIHVYDPSMMARVLFLLGTLVRTFNAQVCLMSATFPDFILAMARRELGIADNHVFHAAPVPELQSRHRIEIAEGTWQTHVSCVAAWIRDGVRVLVICNTVQSAICAFDVFSSLVAEGNAVLLHSRFTVEDRASREKLAESASLLVATQVVEVSLDISFDALLTELAPMDALVQRLGRVNRKNERGSPAPCKILTQEWPESSGIYPEERCGRTLSVLRNRLLYSSVLSDAEAAACVNEVYADGYTEKEQQIYDRVYENMEYNFQNLAAGRRNETMTELFWKLIDVHTVVPVQFSEEYRALVAEKNYIMARQFEISIPNGTFHRLEKSGAIIREGNRLCFVTAPYDRERGLQTFIIGV